MASAFEEALNRVKAGEDLRSASVPSYITNADVLNAANQNKSFLDSAFEVAEDIPKFIGVSVISGLNQLYNIPADVGNLFGADMERSDTAEVISSLDSDLGQFYSENKEGADLVGFLLSSAVPGLAGVKILNAGQKSLQTAIKAGKFGEGMSKSLGLLAPNKGKFLNEAVKEVLTNGSAGSILNRNALKSIASGLGQNTYEALAFESAVAATLFNSPVLENQDFGDFVSNVAWGAGLFGIVGGAIDTTKVRYALKNAANQASQEARPWTYIPEIASKSNTYEALSMDLETIANMASVIPSKDPALAARAVVLTQTAESTKNTLYNRVRKNLAVLTGGDETAADTLFDTLRLMNPQDQQSALIGAMQAGRVKSIPSIAKVQDKIADKIALGTATEKEIKAFKELDLQTSYIKLWGEDAGDVITDLPVITTVVDTLKKGDKLVVSPRGVVAGSKNYKFDTKYNIGAKAGEKGKSWNPLKADVITTNARYLWAQKLEKFNPTANSQITVHVNDIPLMEKVLLEVPPEQMQFVKFTGLDAKAGEEIGSDLLGFIGRRKIQLANKMLVKELKKTPDDVLKEGSKATQVEIAAKVNVKSSLLNGELSPSTVSEYAAKDVLAMQDHAAVYTQKLVDAGVRTEAQGLVSLTARPQHMRMDYDAAPFKGINNFVAENMVRIKEQQKLYQDGTSRAAAGILGKDYFKFEDINSGRIFAGANPSGAGAGLLSAAGNNYGTLGASVENIGRTTAGVILKAKTRSREVFEPLLIKLANKKEAAIEWSAINARVRNIQGEYGLNEAGDALEPLVLIRWRDKAAKAAEAGEQLPKAPRLSNPDMPPSIPLRNREVRDLVKAHIEVNGTRTNGLASIRTAQGNQFNRAPDAFYPIPVDPRDYPHFAIVIDESVTTTGHSKTLYAATTEELDAQIRIMRENPHFKVLTKRDAEEYYKARGIFEYEKTISSNYLDTEALRKGVSAPSLPATDSKKIANDFLNWHLNRETGLVREAVSAKYEVQFEELRRLGEDATNVATSKFSNASLTEFAQDASANPFADYIKTALNVPKTTDYPMWVNLNRGLDDAVSAVYRKIAAVSSSAKTDAELAEIMAIQTRAGIKVAPNYNAEMDLFANATANSGVLSKVVQKANSILATVVLRLDTLNAVNNAISANVLLGAETKAIARGMARGDKEAVGALGDLMKLKVPGVDAFIKSPSKLVSKSIAKFNAFGKDNADMAFYRENGYITGVHDQYKSALDTITYDGKEAISKYGSKLDKLQDSLRDAADKGEVWTGNRLAEEFNRFVAADVMKQMTDPAVAKKLMTSKEQLAYINTFVNRTQGNYLAAQRPMLFQGPIGQAIGLFQTYQFNLLQQLLRHVGEGHAKDSLTLLGLQGTIHGMNGMPAFNAINTNLIGNASGNTEHRDTYDALYGIAGKQAGDWLMYGLASNMMLHPDLKVNLYTRGDINPRHVTLVPTDPSTIPFIQASAKVFGNLYETYKKLGQGGDVSNVLLQGLEHNGISRPLAGLAQTIQGLDNPQQASYSTSKRGNVIAVNDLMSLNNLARVVGGKPLDEAIALDALYRFKAYGLRDAKKRQLLGESIKSTMLAGQNPSTEQIEGFVQQYVETGGRQEEFNQWFGQLYTTANLSQTSKLQNDLNSPFSQSMQKLMGGKELRDFTE